MNHIIIKSQLIESLKTIYGQEIVNKCFELSKEEHPKEVYKKLLVEDKKLASCFEIIFKDLLG